MTKVYKVNPRHLNRDEFITPFDAIFDQLVNKQFPTFKEDVGVSFNKGAYPKVNVYEYDDKVGIVAEIPGLDKSNVSVEVEEDVLIISGDKHGFDSDGGNVSAKFKDGMLSISIPKKEPEQPKKHSVKIS